MRTAVDSDTALEGWAIDALLERYVSWREECQAVWLTYQRWTGSAHDERHLAYAGYLAALDQEEHAARAYADHVYSVRRRCR
jgi:hypothetical protein